MHRNGQAPPRIPSRKAEFDVSGSDGVRFVVLPMPLVWTDDEGEHENDGWGVYDCAYKTLVRPVHAGFRVAYARASAMNAAEAEAA